jgi:hypothetical protein
MQFLLPSQEYLAVGSLEPPWLKFDVVLQKLDLSDVMQTFRQTPLAPVFQNKSLTPQALTSLRLSWESFQKQ